MSVRFGAMHSSPYAKLDLCLGMWSGPLNRAKMRWHTMSTKRSLTVWPSTASDQVLMLRSCGLGEGRRRQLSCQGSRQVGCQISQCQVSNHGPVQPASIPAAQSLRVSVMLEKTCFQAKSERYE